MELKRLYLEGQERQAILEKDLGIALTQIGFLQEVLVNLIREVGFLKEQDSEEEFDTTPPDFILKTGERLEMN